MLEQFTVMCVCSAACCSGYEYAVFSDRGCFENCCVATVKLQCSNYIICHNCLQSRERFHFYHARAHTRQACQFHRIARTTTNRHNPNTARACHPKATSTCACQQNSKSPQSSTVAIATATVWSSRT